MAKHAAPIGTELSGPAQRPQAKKAPKASKVGGPGKAFVGPRTLGQARDQAGARWRRQEIAQQSGDDAQAQKLTGAPDLRAVLVRQSEGGSRPDLQAGRARDPRYQAHGAQLEISVPGVSTGTAQRSPHPFWDVLAAGMAAVEALPQAVRSGRGTPVGAASPNSYGRLARCGRKRKGKATVRLRSGRIRRAELHWYEAHGIGKRKLKIKRFLD